MLRVFTLAICVACILTGSMQGQRTGTMFRDNHAGVPTHSGMVGQGRVFPRRGMFPNRFQHRHFNDGAVLVPYPYPYDDYGYDQPYSEVAAQGPVAPVGGPPADERASRTTDAPVPKAQVIEIPVGQNSATPKTLPPTVFVLSNGERLESRRFVLTTTHLLVSIDRQQRSVPLDMLDLDTTISSNHERGIDLRIPADRNEISLSF
ncbi:MAG TPA: hypothetical protein VGV15_19645 [Terriglobales bacterium]|nr:hypothetical protein [Terriglobales bacterium]